MTQGFTSGLPIPVPIAKGGTGAVTAATALSNLGLTATATNLNLLSGASQTVVQRVSIETGAVATGTTTIPYDDTIPQNTEGDQYMSLSITPKSASNILVIESNAYCANSSVSVISVIALFQDSTVNALAAGITDQPTNGRVYPFILRHIMTAGTTSSTTFKIRIGANGAGTTTFNGGSSARLMGGVMASNIIITEYTP